MGADWIYYAIVAIVAILAVAMQPRPPKQKRPSLEDFSIPRAKQGEPIPMVFGTVTLTGPMVVWYGDLLVETETEDGVRTRRFYMGMHFILCHGPVDHFLKIMAGDRDAWTGDQTESSRITISAGDLFGGKRQSGGISGDVDLMFGESTQLTNTYLASVQGLPQPAYRGVLSVVCNQTYVSANATHIEPWAFKLCRIFEGWDQDDCWYPETAEIPESCNTQESSLFDIIDGLHPSLFLRFEETPFLKVDIDGPPAMVLGPRDGDPQVCVNAGTGPDGEYQYWGGVSNKLVPDGKQSVRLFLFPEVAVDTPNVIEGGQCQIRFPYDTSYSYHDNTTLTFALKFKAAARFDEQSSHCIWHQGDQLQAHNHGIGLFIETDIDDDTDWIIGQIFDYDTSTSPWTPVGFRYCNIALGMKIQEGDEVVLMIELTPYIFPETGGTGLVRVWKGCNATHCGDDSWPTLINGSGFPLPTASYETQIGSTRAYRAGATEYPSYSLRATLDEFVIFPYELDEFQRLAVMSHMCFEGDVGEMNPAHIIYQALTDSRGMGIPVGMIDDDSFREAADIFYNENMGLCLKWVQQEKVEDFIQHVCDHAACVLRVSPRTGNFQLKALRGGYDTDSLPVYDEDQITKVEQWERVGYGELVGEVILTYVDKNTNKSATVSAQNLAVIQAQSGVVTESVDLPGIANECLARRVCMRELKARSIPLARCKFKTNRETWELLPGDVFKLSWAKLGLTEVVMRVGSISTGTLTEGEITIEAVEDVFGMPDSTYATNQASGWTDPVITDPDEDGGSLVYWEDGTQLRQEAGSIVISE